MADDIERHRHGDPVLAQPDTAAYRIGKVARRHWMGVAASAASLVAMQGGAGVAIVLSRRAGKSEERERLTRELVAQVLRVGARPVGEGSDIDVTATQEFLERSASIVQERLAGQPDVQAELYAVISQVFDGMGASRLSCAYGRLRIEALDRAGADRAQRARASLDLAEMLVQDEDFDAVCLHAQQARRFVDGDADIDVKAQALMARGLWEQGQVERAGAILDEVDRVTRGASTAAGTGAAHASWARARLLVCVGRTGDAITAFDQAIEQALAADGETSLTAARIRMEAAFDLAFHPDRGALTHRYLQAAAGALRHAGGQHRLRAAIDFACITARRYPGQVAFDEVRSAMIDARGEAARAAYSIPADLLWSLDMGEGNALTKWGNTQAAQPLIERGCASLFAAARTPGARLQPAFYLGTVLMQVGRHDEADIWLRRGLRAHVEDGTHSRPYVARAYILLAMNLRMAGQRVEAQRVLDEAPDFAADPNQALPDAYNLRLALARSSLALEHGDAHEASQRFPMRLIDPPGLASASSDDSEARFVFGCIACELGRHDEGLANLRAVLGRHEDRYEHRPELAHRRAVAGRHALRAGDRSSALAWARQARESFTQQPGVSDWFKAPLIELEASLGIS